jgi:transcriptional regulator with XRE-family HTH domain
MIGNFVVSVVKLLGNFLVDVSCVLGNHKRMEHPLRTYRKRANITLERLAVAVGVTKGFLSKIETGRQTPSLRIAAKISRATAGAITPNDFLAAPAPPGASEELRAVHSRAEDAA